MIPKFFISRNPFGAVEIYFGARLSDDKTISAEPVQMKVRDAESGLGIDRDAPMLTLFERDAEVALQSLMDQLWAAGVRPADVGTAGHLAATTKHLEDMRAIAFSKMEVPKP